MPEGLICLLVMFGASLAGGISGFGFTLLALTAFSFVFNIKVVVAFLSIHTLVHNIIQVVQLRQHISPRRVLPLILGGVLGVPGGVLFLKHVDAYWIEKLLGLVVLLVVVRSVWQGRVQHPQELGAEAAGDVAAGHGVEKSSPLRTVRGVLFGVSAGSLMGAFFSGCPLAIVYSVDEGGTKYAIKATLQSFFLFSSAYGVTLYALTGLLTGPVFWTSVIFIPVTVVGTILGVLIFEKISSLVFYRLVMIFLTIAGLSLLLR